MKKDFYKFENGKPVKYNGGFIIYNNRIFTNPTEENIRLVYNKDLVFDEKPAYNEGTQYLNEVYTEDDTTIYVGYEVVDIEEEIIEE